MLLKARVAVEEILVVETNVVVAAEMNAVEEAEARIAEAVRADLDVPEVVAEARTAVVVVRVAQEETDNNLLSNE
jgi:hypothetical protein